MEQLKLDITLRPPRVGHRLFRGNEAQNPSRWAKWGFSLDGVCIGDMDSLYAAVCNHNAVADYLERHPEVAAEYGLSQTGPVRYFDVLALAE